MTLTSVTVAAAAGVAALAAVLWLMDRGAREQFHADREVLEAAVAEAERQRDISRQWEQLCVRQQARIRDLERSAHPAAKYPLTLRLEPDRSN